MDRGQGIVLGVPMGDEEADGPTTVVSMAAAAADEERREGRLDANNTDGTPPPAATGSPRSAVVGRGRAARADRATAAARSMGCKKRPPCRRIHRSPGTPRRAFPKPDRAGARVIIFARFASVVSSTNTVSGLPSRRQTDNDRRSVEM